jgi:hypothetical protein
MLPIPENQFMRVMMTDVELKNGASTKMMTIFDNSNIGFEEVFIGIRKGLEFVSEAKSMNCQLFSVEKGTLKESGIKFDNTPIEYWRPRM